MHISLDSALGRQRRLNSVGESVFQIAPDASAGYSLRSLTGGDPSVVRVRRDSDNGERDFRSSEINSGEMVSWVNQQAIKPLDIRELEADGRTGDFLIPKAAYSLRSLGERQATLAATGDTVARADGKFVMQARRSSDDALKSFTAAEVADGTLVTWVTDEQVGWEVQPTMQIASGGGSITSQSSTSTSSTFTVSNTGGDSFLRVLGKPNSILAGTGDSVVVNISVSGLADSTILRLYPSASNTSIALQSVGNGNNQELTLSPSGQVGYFGFTEFNTTTEATVTINSIKVIGKTGFVKTWYDQSVTNQAGGTATGNHAVQATAASQPKIVTSGVMVTGGLDFDGGNDKLDIPNDLISSINSASAFLVADSDTASGTRIPLALSRNNPDFRFYVGALLSNKFYFGYQDSFSKIELGSADTNKHLFTSIAGSSNAEGFLDGTSKGTVSSADGKSALSSAGIGAVNISNFWDGTIQEVIIYNTDQSDNRTALEANIGETYSIAGIPAYANTVNGFVETWYDQSGNGNNATQLTAGSQPKIVDAGSLLTDGITFDGTDQVGLVTGSFSLTQAFTTFSVSHTDDASTSVGIWSTAASATDDLNTVSFFRNDDGFAVNAGATLTTAGTIDYVADRTYLRTNVVNGGSSSIFVDGATGATGNAGSTNPSGILILGYFRSTSYFNLDGAIKELIIYDSDQTSNRAALETNIAAANGVTLS